MSHLISVQTQVRDAAAVAAAWREPAMEASSGRQSSIVFCHDPRASGLRAKLAFSDSLRTADRRLIFDNYSGVWGDEKELNRFKQRYAVEKATIEARRLGRSVLEQQLADGSVKLTISVGAKA